MFLISIYIVAVYIVGTIIASIFFASYETKQFKQEYTAITKYCGLAIVSIFWIITIPAVFLIKIYNKL